MPDTLSQRVAELRAFNRFYTRRIGVLNEHLLHSRFSLAESRVLWELAHHDGISAAALARELGLDPGYLSRLLSALKTCKLIKGERTPHDARQTLLRLSAAGAKAFAPLDQRSQQQTAALLGGLPDAQQRQLIAAAATIEQLLGARAAEPQAPYLLRPHRPGDIGWVVSRHGALYAQEYGLDGRFEALVARIGAHFLEHLEPAREACWIAEREGDNVGSVMLVQAREEPSDAVVPGVAQLRLLLVEPGARGLGIGERLVHECSQWALRAGYRTIRLWTNSNLDAARGIYRKAGYVLMSSEPHTHFGHAQVGEHWELALQ
jgi:DNA-binding MarR family transcriptional regulator/GNAT superfamily N-acetyltransferase